MGWELSWNSFSLYISLPGLSHQFWWLKMSPVCQWLLNYISNQKCLSNSRLINSFAYSPYLFRCQNRPLRLNMFRTKLLISPIFQKKKKKQSRCTCFTYQKKVLMAWRPLGTIQRIKVRGSIVMNETLSIQYKPSSFPKRKKPQFISFFYQSILGKHKIN